MKTIIISTLLLFAVQFQSFSQEPANRKPLIYKPEQKNNQPVNLQKKEAMPLRNNNNSISGNNNGKLKQAYSEKNAIKANGSDQSNKPELKQTENNKQPKLMQGSNASSPKATIGNMQGSNNSSSKAAIGKMPVEKNQNANAPQLGSKTVGE